MKSKISRTQEASSNNRKVEIHDFNITARIPTEQWRTSYFLYSLFGRHSEPMIMSPTGGIATENYFKPIKELERDTGGSGCFSGDRNDENRAKHTDEDTERFWLLNNQAFLEELKQSGWIVFPEVKEVGSWTLDKFNIDSKKIYGREFSLSDLIKAIQITNNDGQNFDKAIQDIEEIQALSDSAHHIYSGQNSFSSHNFIYLPVKFKDKQFNLALDEKGILTSDRRDEQHSMKRTVHMKFDLKPGYNDKLPEDAVQRIHTLIRDYLETTAKGKYSHSQDDEKIRIELRNSPHYSQEDITPDTPALLEQALEIGQTVERIVDAEHAYCKREQESLLTQRKAELGLDIKVATPE